MGVSPLWRRCSSTIRPGRRRPRVPIGVCRASRSRVPNAARSSPSWTVSPMRLSSAAPGEACGRCAARQGSGPALALVLEVLVHPVEVTPETIDQETRSGQHVVLAGINNELRWHAERAQRLVHLLAAADRDIEVLVTAEEERGRADPVRVKEGI